MTIIRIKKQKKFQGTSMVIFIIVLLSISAQACQNPSQSKDSCTSCIGGQILVGGRCYQRMRGCLNYAIKQQTYEIKCIQCQYGYVVVGGICERQAKIRAQKSQVINNSPAPLAADSSKRLEISDIITKYRAQNHHSTPITGQNQSKKLPEFPLIIHQIKSDIVPSKLREEKKQKQNDKVIQAEIYQLFPFLINYFLIQASYFVQPGSDQNQIAQYYFSDGSRVLLKLNNKKQQKNEVIGYSVDKNILELTRVFSKEQKIQLNDVSLSVNYKLSQPSGQKLIVNCENGHLSWIVSSEEIRNISAGQNDGQQNFRVQVLAKVEKRKIQTSISQLQAKIQQKLSAHLLKSYSQFVQIANVVNVPDRINRIEAEISDSNDDDSNSQSNLTIIFHIFYQTGNDSEEEAVLSFNTKNQQTTVLQYKIQGQNILTLFQKLGSSSSSEPNTRLQKKVEQKQYLAEISHKQICQLLLNDKNTQNILKNFYWILQVKPDQLHQLYQVQILTEYGSTTVKLFMNSAKSWQILNNQKNPGYLTPVDKNCAALKYDYKQDQQLVKIDNFLKKQYKDLMEDAQLSVKINIASDKIEFLFIYSNQKLQQYYFKIENSSPIVEKPKYVIKQSKKTYEGFYLVEKIIPAIQLAQILDNKTEFSNIVIKHLKNNYKSYLSQLQQKYSRYLKAAIIESVMSNGTHFKIYLHTSYYILQSLHSKDNQVHKQCYLKAIFKKKQVLSDSPLLNIGLPIGFSKDRIISKSKDLIDYQMAKQIQSRILQKYQYYLTRNYAGFIAQKRIKTVNQKNNQVVFAFVFKSVFGYFAINVLVDETKKKAISYSSIQNMASQQLVSVVKLDQQQEKDLCNKQSEILDYTQYACYEKIQNCAKQISAICIVCNTNSMLNINKTKCSSQCSQIFA